MWHHSNKKSPETRCKNIGTESKYVNNDPKYADFYINPPAELNEDPHGSGTKPQGSGEEPSSGDPTGETGESTKQQNQSLVEQLEEAEPIMEHLNYLEPSDDDEDNANKDE